ncbi:hypothetical protein AAF712_006213 [Marasmius tenuissimus]|uniref:Uncharacterized protein n=1 Tax=Marasmius tenuissimus TaxID=585030 RepID=A0ABR2ZYM8_9AGAR
MKAEGDQVFMNCPVSLTPNRTATLPSSTIIPPTSTPSTSQPQDSGLSIGIIAGIAVGATLASISVLVLLCLYWKRRRHLVPEGHSVQPYYHEAPQISQSPTEWARRSSGYWSEPKSPTPTPTFPSGSQSSSFRPWTAMPASPLRSDSPAKGVGRTTRVGLGREGANGNGAGPSSHPLSAEDLLPPPSYGDVIGNTGISRQLS